MASPTNGVVALPGAARRLRIKYDTISYTVEMADDETVTLAGYVKGPGCPVSVEIDVESAWAEWSEDSPTDEEKGSPAKPGDPDADPPIPPTPAVPGTLTPHRYLAKTMRAERMLRRNLLCAVIPGLAQEVADVLAADAGPWEDILAELGWWQKAEATPEGEAGAGDSSQPTGSAGSPASAPPTTASRSRTPRR